MAGRRYYHEINKNQNWNYQNESAEFHLRLWNTNFNFLRKSEKQKGIISKLKWIERSETATQKDTLCITSPPKLKSNVKLL